MRTVRVGVAGLGTVGGAAVGLLGESRREWLRRLGAEIRVAAVCDRRAEQEARRLRLPPGVRRTRRWRDLVEDPSLDLVVETIGGLEEARRLVLGALRAGKHVVTANKRLLAHHWDEIFDAARAAGRQVRFEASVAGGIPILQAIDQSLAADRIERVLGILNGTTNFILTRMARERQELEEALREARRLGLAERDPRMDLDGTDAAHKTAVLAALLTGRGLRAGSVAHEGILSLRAEDLRYAAAELGRAVRLLGVVEVDRSARPARVTAYVAPTLVPLAHPLAGVHDEYNAVLVQAAAAGDLLFYGKGAGGAPAGSAVAGDVFLLSRDILRGTPEPRFGGGSSSAGASPARRRALRGAEGPRRAPAAVLVPVSETRSAFYLRLRVTDRPGVLSRLTGVLGRHGISIAQIHQDRPKDARREDRSPHPPHPEAYGRGVKTETSKVPIFLTTHPTRHGEMARSIRKILALPFVSPEHACLRLL